jgi:hypothetical protein
MQTQNIKPISEYLESICIKLGKEFGGDQHQHQNQTQKNPQTSGEQQQTQQQNQLISQTDKLKSNSQASTSQLNNENKQIDDQNKESINADENTNDNINDDELVQINEEQAGNAQTSNEHLSNTNMNNLDNELRGGRINASIEETKAIETNNKEENDLVDTQMIELISEHIDSVDEWKSIALKLKMDEDTISFIESENDNIKHQCKKILQLWKVNKFLNPINFYLIYFNLNYCLTFK